MGVILVWKRKCPSVSEKELLEHEFLVEHLSYLFRELLEYLDILGVLKSHILIQRPFVCEELFYCLLQFLVDLDVVVEFLDSSEEFGELITLI